MRRVPSSPGSGSYISMSMIRILASMVAVCSLSFGVSDVSGGMLYPSGFASLGASLSESGTYIVDTNSGLMTLPDGNTIAGDGGGVFTFGSINISGATFVVEGANPFVLLSQGDSTLDGVSISLDASGQTPGPGGDGGPRGGDGYDVGAGGGGGGGVGGQGGPFVFTGIAQLTPPWGDYLPGAPGGGAVIAPLVGGGAGGNSYFGGPLGIGGAGGGAIELGAVNSLSLTNSTISANGGDATGVYSGGGGAGGDIALLGWSVDFASSYLSATGGTGGPGVAFGGPGGAMIGGGGGGGGGQIDVQAHQYQLGAVDLAGGDGGSLGGSPGGSGTIMITMVPEPSGMLLAGTGLFVVAGYMSLCHRGRR